MSPTPTAESYTIRTVMWRMRRRSATMHAMVGLQEDGAVFAWFLNDRPMGVRYFDSCSAAIQWSEQMQSQSWAVGWRFAPEGDESASSGGGQRHA